MARFMKSGLRFIVLLLVCGAAEAQWRADKPIRIIVPWTAGGSTDQMARVTALELENALGQPVTVINQPGSSGAIGTQNVLDAPHDGYTFSAGAVKDLGCYKLLGMVDTTLQDWHLYLTVRNVSLVSVNINSPYRNIDELLAAMRSRPGEIRVAMSGVNSSGHAAMQSIARSANVQVQQMMYDGGPPAALAVVAGEADVTTQLAAEQIAYIKAGRLRPLAVVSEKPLVIEGYGKVESLARSLPGFTDPPNYFGIFVPRGLPPAMVAALDGAWTKKIANSRHLQEYARTHGAYFEPAYGDEAVDKSMPAVRAYAWAHYAAGRARMSPAQLGIAQP